MIRGYRADIDPLCLGLNVAAIIRMACDGEQYRRFVAFLETCENVRECHHVTGSDALMIKVLVGSIEELEQLVMKFLRFGVPTTTSFSPRRLRVIFTGLWTRSRRRNHEFAGKRRFHGKARE